MFKKKKKPINPMGESKPPAKPKQKKPKESAPVTTAEKAGNAGSSSFDANC